MNWISVKDALPEKSKKYNNISISVVVTGILENPYARYPSWFDPHWWESYYCYESNTWNMPANPICENAPLNMMVTHWLKVPELPDKDVMLAIAKEIQSE